MNDFLLKEADENASMITLEFLEDGYLLKTGQSAVHRCELDLIVSNSITLDELLAGIYVGLGDILSERYQIDLSIEQGDVLYRRLESVYEMRDASREAKRTLRPSIEKNIKLRIGAIRYKAQRRKIVAMESQYPMDEPFVTLPFSEQQEREGWLVCWQIFQECYVSYALGYSENPFTQNRGFLRLKKPICHPVIYRSTVACLDAEAGGSSAFAGIPLLWLEKRHGHLSLRELGFRTSSRLVFDPVLWHQSSALFNGRTTAIYAPAHNITPYAAMMPKSEEITVPAPDPLPEATKQDIISLAMAPLVTTAATFGVAMVNPIADSLLTAGLMAAAMGLTTLGVAAIANMRTKRAQEKSMDAWRKSYESYIRWTIETIQERQKEDCAILQCLYPPVFEPKTENDLIRKTLMLNGNVFSRQPGDDDFLSIRLGLSTNTSELVPSLFPIIGQAEKEPIGAIRYINAKRDSWQRFHLLLPQDYEDGDPKYEGFLRDLPQTLAKEYAYLCNAPVLLNLQRNRVCGLVIQDRKKDFLCHLSALLLDLCFHHSPDHVQIVMLCPDIQGSRQQQEYLYRFKYLPHFRKLFQDRSSFAFGAEEAWSLMDRVWRHIKHCISHPEEKWQPHIIFVAVEEYALNKHPLASMLSADHSQDHEYRQLSFLFCKHLEADLPKNCTSAVVYRTDGSGLLLPDPHKEYGKNAADKHIAKAKYTFIPDAIETINYARGHEMDLTGSAFNMLSLYHYREKNHLETPTYYTTFQMICEQADSLPPHALEFEPGSPAKSAQSICDSLTRFIAENWDATQYKGEAAENLAVPIGKSNSAVVSVDMRRTADGSHLLVTGDAYTGKSNFLQNFFLTLAALNAPQRVQFAMVDMAGVGICARLKDLPHTAYVATSKQGTLTDIQLQAKKLVVYLDEQIRARRLQMSMICTDDIDEYNAAVQNMENHIYRVLRLHAVKDQERIEKLKTLQCLPHLFVCIDDLDQLLYTLSAAVDGKSFDLMAQLEYLMGNADGTGVHLVAAARQVSGYMTQRMLDLFEVRVCLPSADKAAQDCADTWSPYIQGEMCYKGRAWVCSKRSSRTEYVQLAYADDDISRRSASPYRMTLANINGQHTCFFDSEAYVDKIGMHSDRDVEAVWRVRKGDQIKTQMPETQNTEDVIYVHPLNQDDVEAVLQRSREGIWPRRDKGDRCDSPPQIPKDAHVEQKMEDVEEVIVERPDAILHGTPKVGMTQADAMVRTICKLQADLASRASVE